MPVVHSEAYAVGASGHVAAPGSLAAGGVVPVPEARPRGRAQNRRSGSGTRRERRLDVPDSDADRGSGATDELSTAACAASSCAPPSEAAVPATGSAGARHGAGDRGGVAMGATGTGEPLPEPTGAACDLSPSRSTEQSGPTAGKRPRRICDVGRPPGVATGLPSRSAPVARSDQQVDAIPGVRPLPAAPVPSVSPCAPVRTHQHGVGRERARDVEAVSGMPDDRLVHAEAHAERRLPCRTFRSDLS